MSKSIYDKVNSRIDVFGEIIQEFVFNPEMQESIYKKYGSNILDQLKYIHEINQFKKEYSGNGGERFLKNFLDRYETLKKFLLFPDKSGEDKKSLDIWSLSICINQIVNHLTEILKPEIETQEQPKPTAQPKGQTKLTRTQTSLLFWYLRERCLIAQPSNTTLATAIESITGHQAKQIKDILKMPDTSVYELGKGNDKVNSNDFAIIILELKTLIARIEREYKNHPDKEE